MPDLEHDPALAAFVAEKAKEHRVPGISVGVIHDGHWYAETQGVTSTSDPLPVDADTLFMIGSTTKTLTATALMALVDEGRLALTDKVIDHLPDFAVGDEEATRTVTVGQLLNHTSGWRGDALPDTGYGADALALAMAVVAEGPQEYTPGTHVSYNNAAVMVAGHLIATLTGKDYETAVTELVLTPLGMTSTFFQPWEVALRRTAVGHIAKGDEDVAYTGWPIGRGMAPAGAALSTLQDQLTYMAYHLDGKTDAKAPLQEETRLLMQQSTATSGSTITGVGISWLLNDFGGARVVGHGGNISNLQTSTFSLLPDQGLAVTVMGNSRGGAAVGAELLTWAVEHYLGREPRQPLPTLPLTPELITDYVGSYDVGPWKWGVTTTDGKLFVEMLLPADLSDELRAAFGKPPVEMVLVGPDQLGIAASPLEPMGDFIRGADGKVAWFRYGMRMAPLAKEN